MGKIKNIIYDLITIADGWKNVINKTATIEEIADIRRQICMRNECKSYEKSKLLQCFACKECGCPIEAKIRTLRKQCPKGLWGHIDEVNLIITRTLFERSGFKEVAYNKFVKGNIFFNLYETYAQSDKDVVCIYWKEVENYYKEQTGKILK